MIAFLKRLLSHGRSTKTAEGVAPRPPTSLEQIVAKPPAEPEYEVAPVLTAAASPVFTAERHAVGADQLGGEDDDDVDPEELPGEDDADDPTIGRSEPLQISLPIPEEILAARQGDERLALSGPHRITPNDPAGPGSLAETLMRLEAQGLVISQIIDDPEDGFYILYTPST